MPVEPPNGLIWRVSMRTRKPYIGSMLVAAIAFSLFACIDRGDPTSPGAAGAPNDVSIAVVLPSSSLEVGHAVTAAAVATTPDGKPVSTDSIEWSSSDTSVLRVNQKGLVTARKVGNGAIYATWRKNSGKRPLAVTDTMPAKVVVSPSQTSQAVGRRTTLTAAVSTSTGRPLPGHLVRWTSTNTSTATVTEMGSVTALKPGTAKVIATTDKVADTAIVTVSPAAISSLSVSPNTTALGSGETQQLTAHAKDAEGNELTGRTVGWASSDEDVATVSTSGLVTAVKVGSATITATSEGVHATATIRVAAGSVGAVSVSPGSVGLVAGKSQQLSASLVDDAGNTLPAHNITWSSANNSIASVSSSGVVNALHAGSTTITASANGVSGHASVVVSAGAVENIAVSPSSMDLTSGDTQQLSAKLTDASGNVLSENVAWSSSNSSVATVSSSGLVTAAHSGSATITAASGGATGSATLTVTAGSVSSVSVSPGSASLVAGETQQLSAKLTDASGSVVSGQSVTWSSSNSAVVSVSSSGSREGGARGQCDGHRYRGW
jgi:Bacterial surface proteins containing Ig-like domains